MSGVLAYHGTSVDLGPVIAREGLRGRGRPVFVAQDFETARRYARARAARGFMVGADPVGLVLAVEVDADELEPDPWEPVGEPGQYLVRGDVLPAQVVEAVEVRFPWSRMLGGRAPVPAVGLIAGMADWAALEGARAEGQDRWAPQDAASIGRDLRALDEVTREARRRPPARP